MALRNSKTQGNERANKLKRTNEHANGGGGGGDDETYTKTHRSPVDVGQSTREEPYHRPRHVLQEVHRRHSVEVVAQREWEDGAESEKQNDLKPFLRYRLIQSFNLGVFVE